MERAARGFQHLGVVGQAEVVVRPQHDPLHALDHHDRVLGLRDRLEIGVEPLCLDLVRPGELAALLEQRDVGLYRRCRHESPGGGR